LGRRQAQRLFQREHCSGIFGFVVGEAASPLQPAAADAPCLSRKTAPSPLRFCPGRIAPSTNTSAERVFFIPASSYLCGGSLSACGCGAGFLTCECCARFSLRTHSLEGYATVAAQAPACGCGTSFTTCRFKGGFQPASRSVGFQPASTQAKACATFLRCER
jgi:hypothetical protein